MSPAALASSAALAFSLALASSAALVCTPSLASSFLQLRKGRQKLAIRRDFITHFIALDFRKSLKLSKHPPHF
jgi:hypothetical protein